MQIRIDGGWGEVEPRTTLSAPAHLILAPPPRDWHSRLARINS